MNKPARRLTAFSLIELLVVLAVVAFLAALVFPALSRMSARGAETKCLSNLRQITAGMLMWASENNGKLPPQTFAGGLQWNNPGSPFFEYLLKKTGTANNWIELLNTVLRCPGSNVKGTPTGERDNSYGRNTHLGIADYVVDAARQQAYETPLTRIENPSKAALVADWPIPNFQRYTLSTPARVQNLWSRHNNRMLVGYADGRADAVTRRQFEAWEAAGAGTQEQRDYRMFLTGLERNNPDF